MAEQEQSQGTLTKQKRTAFVMSPHHLFCNSNITAEAKSLWVVLESKPDGWKFFWSEILKHFKEGRDQIKEAMKELEKLGYVQKKKAKKGNLLCGMDIQVFYDPLLPFDPHQQNQGIARITEIQEPEDQESDFQSTKSQQSETRLAENKGINKKPSKQYLSKQYLSTDSEIWFEEFWKNTYHKTTDSKGIEGSKGSKSEAKKQWDKLLKEGESPVHIIWGVRAYLKKIEGRIQNCHAERFLRDKRYEEYIEDEIERREKENQYHQESEQKAQDFTKFQADPFWLKAKEDLMNSALPAAWKEPVKDFLYCGKEGENHIIKVPSKFYRDWYSTEYREIFTKIFSKFVLIL